MKCFPLKFGVQGSNFQVNFAQDFCSRFHATVQKNQNWIENWNILSGIHSVPHWAKSPNLRQRLADKLDADSTH